MEAEADQRESPTVQRCLLAAVDRAVLEVVVQQCWVQVEDLPAVEASRWTQEEEVEGLQPVAGASAAEGLFHREAEVAHHSMRTPGGVLRQEKGVEGEALLQVLGP
jgi:hypothetical protein